jgi:hypothetical protein
MTVEGAPYLHANLVVEMGSVEVEASTVTGGGPSSLPDMLRPVKACSSECVVADDEEGFFTGRALPDSIDMTGSKSKLSDMARFPRGEIM